MLAIKTNMQLYKRNGTVIMNEEYNLTKGVLAYFMVPPQNLSEESGKPRANSR
jgi:hypothetical protein